MTREQLQMEILRVIRPGTYNLAAVVAEIMASVDRYTASQSPINNKQCCGSQTTESERQPKES